MNISVQVFDTTSVERGRTTDPKQAVKNQNQLQSLRTRLNRRKSEEWENGTLRVINEKESGKFGNLQSVNLVAFLEEKFSKVRTILTSDTCSSKRECISQMELRE